MISLHFAVRKTEVPRAAIWSTVRLVSVKLALAPDTPLRKAVPVPEDASKQLNKLSPLIGVPISALRIPSLLVPVSQNISGNGY